MSTYKYVRIHQHVKYLFDVNVGDVLLRQIVGKWKKNNSRAPNKYVSIVRWTRRDVFIYINSFTKATKIGKNLVQEASPLM